MSTAENLYYEGRIKVPYKWNVGEIGSHFLINLRDKKEIWGIKCPKCGKVYVPPVKTCWECFVPTTEWVKLGNTGIIESFTIVHYTNQIIPKNTPIIYALIRLDGADGSILHLIGDADPTKLKVGMRVSAVFADERTGHILDIKHFTPIKA